MNSLVKPLADSYTGKLSDYKPFEKFSSLNLSDNLKVLIKDTANKHLDEAYPQITATDYMRLVRDGNRSEYEKKYFAKRFKLTSLTAEFLCELSGEDKSPKIERLLDEIINGIWSICEETSWCLPAHNTYIRDTPQIILPDITKPVMDLFACETGATLSMIYYLLRDQLDKVSPLICERICLEVNKRIIKPYISTHFWWMGNGMEPMCNWTVWCTQNTLLCTFLLPSDSDTRREIFDKACYGIDCFLKDYGNDGCCDEGAQYYRHAGLCLFGCLDILNSVTDGHFASLFDDVKIKNIAEFIVNVHIGDKYYVNFSDCSTVAGNCGVREYLFGKLCKLQRLSDLAIHDFAEGIENGTLFEDESVRLNLYYRIQTIFFSSDILNCVPADSTHDLADIFYESVGVCILRNDSFTLAVKSGDNDDSHNHNDTGSIILFKGLDPIFIDIGPETYTKKTFSTKRYEIWTIQSCYHNLPTIDGLDQMAGSTFKASDVKVDIDNPKFKHISMNILGAYPINSSLTYTRSAAIDMMNNSVILSDTCSIAPSDLKNGIILNFITYHKPQIDESLHTITIGSANVTYEGASSAVIEVLPITDERLKKAWDHDLYRLRFEMISKDFKLIVH